MSDAREAATAYPPKTTQTRYALARIPLKGQLRFTFPLEMDNILLINRNTH